MKLNEIKHNDKSLSEFEGVINISPVLFYLVSPERYANDEDELEEESVVNLVLEKHKAEMNKTLTFYKLISQY